MKLLNATVKGSPREVTTKYGDRTVLDCITAEGTEATIWRPAGDTEVLGHRNGERVTLAVDSKGKFHLMESLSTGLTELQQQSESNGNGSRASEIADYAQRLTKLYKYCFKGVLDQFEDAPVQMDTEDVRAIATTVFIQTVRHFDL